MSVESKALPAIPAKRYFTIGEVSELCGVKAYVLRYWEQEFTQLKPMKRRGNRRYYQHHEVLLIRRIRDLLYEQGFTISGARNQLTEHAHARAPAADDAGLPVELAASAAQARGEDLQAVGADVASSTASAAAAVAAVASAKGRGVGGTARAAQASGPSTHAASPASMPTVEALRAELLAIRALLVG
jgi:DNA-binding transcriptional MerR regulator